MSLFDKIDETAASDADYITTSTAGSVAELKLGPVADPGVDTGHSIKVRASGSGTLGVDLVQGNGASMMIWTSRTRQRQPQASRINWGNSATRGLVDAWVGSVPTRTEKGQTTSIQTAGAFSVGPGGRNFTTTATGTKTGLRLAASYTSWFPSASTATIVVCYRYTDTTARASALFGADQSTGRRILAHAPYSDGNVYWDFGNTSGGRLVVTGFSKTTNVETMIFIAGPVTGRQVWRNGVLLGSGASSDSASVTAPLALGTADIASAGADSDNVEFYAFATLAREYSAGEAATVSRNPWQLFAPTKRPIYFQTQKLIASRTIPLIATPTDYRRELLPAEAALITDYADLRVRFRGV